jgi:hypothetical protein
MDRSWRIGNMPGCFNMGMNSALFPSKSGRVFQAVVFSGLNQFLQEKLVAAEGFEPPTKGL